MFLKETASNSWGVDFGGNPGNIGDFKEEDVSRNKGMVHNFDVM